MLLFWRPGCLSSGNVQWRFMKLEPRTDRPRPFSSDHWGVQRSSETAKSDIQDQIYFKKKALIYENTKSTNNKPSLNKLNMNIKDDS